MSLKSVLNAVFCCAILLCAATSFAENQYRLLAQSGTDAYDPFVDYSEFEEVSEEEADINFFRNGRFFYSWFCWWLPSTDQRSRQHLSKCSKFWAILELLF